MTSIPHTPRECSTLLRDILEMPPSEIGRFDIALLNLLCAPGLPGSDGLNLPVAIERLDRLTAFVNSAIEGGLSSFRQHPASGCSEAKWRMGMLVTKVKRDFGASYNPSARAELEAGINAPFTDSREVFIHGLLDDDPNRRWGTCTSIPVLITAVARRLGYPVYLAVTRNHLYARWEGRGDCFNIEASNPQGMVTPIDEYYRNWPRKLTGDETKSHFYLRSLSPHEEFAKFLEFRVYCMRDAAAYGPSLPWLARALQLAPDDPHMAEFAFWISDHAMYQRNYVKYPGRQIPRRGEGDSRFMNVGDLMDREERSWFMTIQAHHHESKGELDQARTAFETACRQRFDGHHEQRDLQRFLRKHGLPRKSGPLLPPNNWGFPRRITLFCKPEEEAESLRSLAAQCEGTGELVKARDVLHDLYMFDPGDAEVFQRGRALEHRPEFQIQFKVIYERQRQILESQGLLRSKTANTTERSNRHVLQS